MSDTPRTDAAKEWHDCTNKRCGEYVTADFACELERENAALREDKARLEREVRNLNFKLANAHAGRALD